MTDGADIYEPSRRLDAKLTRRLTFWRAARPARIRLQRPIVSFTFDDFPRSAAQLAAPILARAGGRGSYFACGSFAGLTNFYGPLFTAEDIHALSAAGHEIGCHTYAHVDCARLPLGDVFADMVRNAEVLSRLGLSEKLTSFAYPFGETTRNLKNSLPCRFTSARGVLGGLNIGDVDLCQLRAQPLFGEGAQERAQALIARAARTNGWAIFYTHDVGAQPSRWGSTTTALERAAAAALACGAEILPIREAVERVREGEVRAAPRATISLPPQTPQVAQVAPAPEPVTIVIPTFRRPDSFLRAARSALRQNYDGPFEIVVIDNAPEASAANAVRTLQNEAKAPVRAAHEPRPGVAHARNAAMRLVRTPLVAFLDDDQEAPADWLTALMRTRAASGADVVWGPVHARIGAGEDVFRRYVEDLYSRRAAAREGAIGHHFGIGNCLLARDVILSGDAPFALEKNETGGEDDLVFSAAQRRGARFAWSPAAHVIEHVPQSRADLAYTLRRAFAYGQGPSAIALAHRDPLHLARHVTVGAGQALVFGMAASAAFAFGAPQRYMLLDRAARGAGKVMFWAQQKFYGASAPAEPR